MQARMSGLYFWTKVELLISFYLLQPLWVALCWVLRLVRGLARCCPAVIHVCLYPLLRSWGLCSITATVPQTCGAHSGRSSVFADSPLLSSLCQRSTCIGEQCPKPVNPAGGAAGDAARPAARAVPLRSRGSHLTATLAAPGTLPDRGQRRQRRHAAQEGGGSGLSTPGQPHTAVTCFLLGASLFAAKQRMD